jgi:anti-anti-sigma factor
MTIIDFPTTPDATTRLDVAERFDAHEVETFTTRVAAVPAGVVLDLSRVRFVDSAGLHALVEARANAIEQGHDLVVDGISQTARITFELAGLAEAFPTVADLEAA